MDHLRDIELIEWAAGWVSVEERAEAEAHLATCLDCQGRLDAVRQTWRTLGQWQLAAGRDLAAGILEAAGRQTQLLPVPTWRRVASLVLRAAAAIVLAAGIGHAAGRWAWPRSTGSPPIVAKADERAASEALSLDVFAQQSVANLAEAVIDLDAPAKEAQP